MVTDNREVLQSLGVLITDQGFFTACAFIGSLPLPGYGLLTVHPVMDILHFLWSIVLTLGLLGQSYTGRLQLPPSKRCKVKSSHTKCHYSLIVKEMDSSKCPSLSQQETRLGLGDKPATMQNEQPSVLSHLYVKNLEELQKKVHDLETKLYSEMVENRQLQTTVMLQEQGVNKVKHSLEQQWSNVSTLISQLKVMNTAVDKQRSHYHSIDNKLAGVMLDIVEINNVLADHFEARTLTHAKEGRKVIEVEAPAKVSACAISPNATKYRDCEEVYHKGHTRSGVYYITPLYTACPIPVYCDMETPPGGWLVFQRRQDGTGNFNRNWHEYRSGFGDVNGEFWLGNDNLFLLTNQHHYNLRVDLWDFYGSRVYAEYRHFKVDGQRDRYRLHVSNHSGTAPDGLGQHDGVLFSTPDHDNDQWTDYHCAKEWNSGWWFSNCWFVILNGLWHNTTDVKYRGISWNEWKAEQLNKVEMKMRPNGF